MNPSMGQVTFTRSERARLAECCKALGITFAELAKTAVMQAVDEVEGLERSARVEKVWRARATNGSSHGIS